MPTDGKICKLPVFTSVKQTVLLLNFEPCRIANTPFKGVNGAVVRSWLNTDILRDKKTCVNACFCPGKCAWFLSFPSESRAILREWEPCEFYMISDFDSGPLVEPLKPLETFIIPPANFVCRGYTVFTLSVHASVRPSVTLCFLNNSKSHCWIFIKPCKHVHICKTNTLDKKVRARGQFY